MRIKTHEDIEDAIGFAMNDDWTREDLAELMEYLRRECPDYEDLLYTAALYAQMMGNSDAMLLEMATPAKKHASAIAGASEGGKKGVAQRKREGALADQASIRAEFAKRLQAGAQRSMIVAALARLHGVSGRRINQILKKTEA